ncbi:MAG TPA: GntR family transcriptional regulator [Egibacteraceae bacterium]|nr:GntR family transcriptional regulator [Egibacteraceae bacterium]
MADAIQKTNPMPYYAQLAQILRDQIQAGRWQPGDLLPSEADMCASYGISRTAVRQALDELVHEGLVQKEKGRGTFVRRPMVAESLVQELRGFFEEMTRRGEVVHSDILGQEVVPAPPFVAEELQLSMDAPALRLDRIRRIGDEPIVSVRTYMPMPRFAPLVDRDMREASLYALLAEEFNVHATSGRRRFEAVPADDETAAVLQVPPGSALMKVTAVNFDQDDVPFEHFVACYRGDRTVFDVLVEPGSGRADAVLDVDTRGAAAAAKDAR